MVLEKSDEKNVKYRKLYIEMFYLVSLTIITSHHIQIRYLFSYFISLC